MAKGKSMLNKKQKKSIVQYALSLIAIGFILSMYQYTITNPQMNAYITNLLTQTTPIVFLIYVVIGFFVLWYLKEQFK